MDQVYTCAFNIIFENYPKANDAFNNLSKGEIKNLEDIFSYSNLENNLIEFYKAYSIGYPEYLNRKLIFKSMHSITLMSECKDLSKIFDQNNINYAFIKGASFNLNKYHKKRLRFISDIDILIEFKDMKKAIDILLNNNFSLSNKYSINKKYWYGSLENNLDIGLYSPKKSLIELHASLTGKNDICSKKFNADALKNRVLVDSKNENYKFYTLDDNSYILHIAQNYIGHSVLCSGIKFIYDFICINKKNALDIHKLNMLSSKYDVQNEFLLLCSIINYFHKNFIENSMNENIEGSIINDAIDLSFNNRYSENYVSIVNNSRLNLFPLLKKILYIKKNHLSHFFNCKVNARNYIILYIYFLIIRLLSIPQKINKNKIYSLKKYDGEKVKNIIDFLRS